MKRVPIKDATLSLCGWAYQLYVRLGCVYILLVLRTDATRTRNPGTWAQPQGRAKEQELWVNGEEKAEVNGAQTVFNRRNYAIARRWAWTGSHLSQWVETSWTWIEL